MPNFPGSNRNLTLWVCFPRDAGTLFAGSVAPFVAAGHKPPGGSSGGAGVPSLLAPTQQRVQGVCLLFGLEITQ